MQDKDSLLYVRPGVPAKLDPGFAPAILAIGNYESAAGKSGRPERLLIAVERENGYISRCDLELLPSGRNDSDTLRYVERHIKFILWSKGGWKLVLHGPKAVCDFVKKAYSQGGLREFDARLMQKAYDHEFAVEIAGKASDVPEAKESRLKIGGNLDGCRVGFDLGASDYKLAAVIDGKAVFSTEIPWTPVKQPDPSYHYKCIVDGLRQAASHMPRLDAIGGSSAGIIVGNQVKVASLFRAVPEERFNKDVKPIFQTIQKELGVPLVVMNDGDVTALAGAMSLKKNSMLGIAMGSSEAGGYLDPKGCLTGYLTELAFAPVDFNEQAASDEWSGDRGVGALYFSQQAVNKLAPAAGFNFKPEMPLPERLVAVQEKADKGDKAALGIFETIGVYLAYAVPLYGRYYDYENMLVLGRVTSGMGGELLMSTANDVLKKEFPEVAEKVTLHVPDEKSRRVGQAVAAASLPATGKTRKDGSK
ncbi:MAG: transcriptional regulator [Verrucomicrobia bacterium]|nr:transcriptional regulator [Verrucomicrobiota bacterium]